MALLGFIIGLIITILGMFVWSYSDHNINIIGLEFNSEKLGQCLLLLGGILSGVMFIGLIFSTP
jgi:hypothetical protein